MNIMLIDGLWQEAFNSELRMRLAKSLSQQLFQGLTPPSKVRPSVILTQTRFGSHFYLNRPKRIEAQLFSCAYSIPLDENGPGELKNKT